MRRLEAGIESLLFRSRWLLAPFYLGLALAVLMLLVKFVQELLHFVPSVVSSSEKDVILSILTLVDMSLVANLLMIVIFSGYENFVSKIDTAGHVDRPDWMGKVSFSGLKLKLFGSLVAISGIELLKVFMNSAEADDRQLAWKVGIHLTFVVSGVLFALMDRLAGDHP
ncbi:MAG: hypothetical protein B7Z66_08455 [Chromatiales bacterium 21-64-14]|nr:MAG: hypothetical protein B7Z66_08455 [Chromatiales bacterium 21-64-14]HQU15367.1 TIGR00645 family protein [Gammaproteobacteria bacterium]